VRFWNNDIFDNIEGVQTMILEGLRLPHAPDPHPPSA
jgi:very-short-patch-repair endonuclease